MNNHHTAPKFLGISALLFGLLPFINTFRLPPLSQFWPQWVCAALALLIICTTALAAERSLRPLDVKRLPTAAVSAGFAALFLLLQIITRRPMFLGEAGVATLQVTLAFLFCLAAASLRRQGNLEGFLDAFAMGLLLALMVNTAQILLELNGHQLFLGRIVSRPLGERVVGLFGQPNQVAVFSTLGWGASFYLWLRDRLPAIAQVLSSGLVALNCAAAGSRAGLICFVITIILSYTSSRFHPKRFDAKRLIGLALALYVITGVGYIKSGINTKDDLNNTITRTDTIGRLELLRDGLELVRLHPLLGVGFGNFSGARWEELDASMTEPTTTHAHNVVVQLAAEFGVPSALIILLPLVGAIWTCARSAIRAKAKAEEYFCAQIALVIGFYSLVEYPLWYLYFLFPFAFALGAGESSLPLHFGWKPGRKLIAAFGGVSTLACVIIAIDYSRLQSLYWDASAELATSDNYTMHLPRQTVREISLLTGFDMWSELMLSRTLDLDDHYIDQKLAISRRAMRGITNEETIARYISFLTIAGRETDALAMWRKTARGADLREQTIPMLRIFASSNAAVAAFTESISAAVDPKRP